jgi:hypothetical protein
MSLHTNNQFNAVCLAEKQQIPILLSGLTLLGLKTSMLTVTTDAVQKCT